MDQTLLEAATRGNRARFCELVEEEPGRLASVSVQGNTILHVLARLGDASLASREVDSLLQRIVNWGNWGDDTALHLAARAGHKVVVVWLLAIPDCHLTAVNKKGDTALHDAVRYGHEEVVRELIRRSPSLASMANKLGETPLYLAAERTLPGVVGTLLESEHSTWEGPGGMTALHAAVHRSYDIAKMLLYKKPESSRKQDSRLSTPLHYAASAGDLRMVRLLLQYDTSVAYISDAEGLSPLHVAAAMGHAGVIQELIKTCPVIVESVDDKGRNILHFAVEKKRSDVVKYVLKTPLLKGTINEQDYEGNTALHLAIVNRNREIVQMLLADKRVSTNTTNHQGFTPLDLASLHDKSYIGLRMYKIRQALVSAGSLRSPQRLDHVANERPRDREEEATRCRTIANNLTVVAVLIATVTFAAAFTLPGGYKNDSGTAILTKKAAFKAFIVSDATAMVSSIIIINLLIHTGSVDHDVRLRSISASMKLMQVALAGMAVAFATGVYVVTAAECKWLAILVCVLVCGIPLWMHAPLPDLEQLRLVKTYLKGKKATAVVDDKNMRVLRIYMPQLDFRTPPSSEDPELLLRHLAGRSHTAKPRFQVERDGRVEEVS